MERLKKSLSSSSPNQRINLGIAVLIGILAGFFTYYQFTSFSNFFVYYDPEFAYMFSSLSIFKGQTYAYVDHPGTPLELLGSLILLFTYPFVILKSGSFINFHLENPIYFLLLARFTLLVFSSVTLIFLAKETVPASNRNRLLKVFIILASYYALHPDSFLSLTLLSHNSINFPGGTLILLLSWMILRKNEPVKLQEKIIIGFAAGVLTAFQLYFSTWVIGAIVSFGAYEWYSNQQLKNVIKTGLTIGFSSLAGFFLMTIPIYKNLPKFFSFVFDLATHEGLYGNGREGFTSPERYLGNFFIYSKILTPLFLTLIFLVLTLHVLIFVKKWKINSGIKAFTVGIFIQIFLAFAIILKHPLQIYFLSLAAMIPMLFAIFFHVLDSKQDWGKLDWNFKSRNQSASQKHVITVGFFIIMVILFGANLRTAIVNHVDRLGWIRADQRAVDQTLLAYGDQISKQTEDINLLWTYETYSPCYARWYGNDYADFVFTPELTQVCENNLHISLWTGQVLTHQGWISPNDFEWDIIVLKAGIVEFLPKILENGTFIQIENSDMAIIVPPDTSLDFLQKID